MLWGYIRDKRAVTSFGSYIVICNSTTLLSHSLENKSYNKTFIERGKRQQYTNKYIFVDEGLIENGTSRMGSFSCRIYCWERLAASMSLWVVSLGCQQKYTRQDATGFSAIKDAITIALVPTKKLLGCIYAKMFQT